MNKEIKIIDLLNKIANGEDIPVHIKIKNYDWYFYASHNTYGDKNGAWILWDWYVEENRLNDEVEIIEEDKKIEKLNLFDLTVDNNEKDEDGNDLELHYTGVADTFDEVYDKINELIDEINKLKEYEK